MYDLKGYNELPEAIEGNTSHFPISYRTLFEFVKQHKPKTILEVGFNAGHSACCFLNASPDAAMYSFDVCQYGIEKEGLEVLQKYFNIQLIEGNSKDTLPKWLDENKILFDFIFIDGDHGYPTALSDINTSIPFLSQNGHIIVDDAEFEPVTNAIRDSNIWELDVSFLENSNKRIIVGTKTKKYIM